MTTYHGYVAHRLEVCIDLTTNFVIYLVGHIFVAKYSLTGHFFVFFDYIFSVLDKTSLCNEIEKLNFLDTYQENAKNDRTLKKKLYFKPDFQYKNKNYFPWKHSSNIDLFSFFESKKHQVMHLGDVLSGTRLFKILWDQRSHLVLFNLGFLKNLLVFINQGINDNFELVLICFFSHTGTSTSKLAKMCWYACSFRNFKVTILHKFWVNFSHQYLIWQVLFSGMSCEIKLFWFFHWIGNSMVERERMSKIFSPKFNLLLSTTTGISSSFHWSRDGFHLVIRILRKNLLTSQSFDPIAGNAVEQKCQIWYWIVINLQIETRKSS